MPDWVWIIAIFGPAASFILGGAWVALCRFVDWRHARRRRKARKGYIIDGPPGHPADWHNDGGGI